MVKKASFFLISTLFLLVFNATRMDGPALAQEARAPQTQPYILKGVVVSLSGSVKFRNEETVLWQDVRLGQEVIKGDHIRTEENGQVSIEFTNGNLLSLKEDSAIIIDELYVDPATGKYDAVFETIKSKIKAEVNDSTNLRTFEIRTPTAVAGVRGTIFFVIATQSFTEVFVNRGHVNLRNTNSQNEHEVHSGFSVTADEQGGLSEPAVPDPEKMLEFEGFLEPQERLFAAPSDEESSEMPPLLPEDEALLEDDALLEEETLEESGSLSEEDMLLFTQEDLLMMELEYDQEQFEEDQMELLFDQQLSQEADKTDYISDPPLPTGSNLADTDGDGMLNSVDPDDDNDFLFDLDEFAEGTNPLNLDTDNDASTDWEELRLTNTDVLDPDSDGDNIDDGGDAFPNESTIFDNMTNVRTWRYNKIDTIAGLRTEISSLLASSAERQRDFIMDRISDAQIHKVLRDRSANWVRYEEYILRPTPNEVGALTLTYRAGAQISSLNWNIIFNNSMDAMDSQAIKNLPWDVFFSLTPDYGATAPVRYPTQMSVELENATGTNSVEERRTLNAPAFSGSWQQGVASNQVSIDNGAFNNFSTINLIAGNPAAFDYDVGGPIVDFFVYVVNDDDGTLDGGSFNYASLWEVIGTNLSGFESIASGQHLEVQANYAGPTQIDVVYVPMSELLWRGDSDWPQLLTW